VRTIILAVAVALSVAFGAHGQRRFDFYPHGINLAGAIPGERFAWLGMGGDDGPRDNTEYVRAFPRVVSGLQPITSDGTYAISMIVPDSAIVLAVGIDHPWELGPVTSGGCSAGPPIVVSASVGATQFTVHTTGVYGNYVRPGGSAWSFDVFDGGPGDADGAANGSVVVQLAQLTRFFKSTIQPAAIAAGDKILLIDTLRKRASIHGVTQ
jgi:hypothetical protein